MCRPDLSLLPIPEALQLLTAWLAPQLPPKIKSANEKASDAEIAAVALLQPLHKQMYFSSWWALIKINFCPHLPSLTQATIRLCLLVLTLEIMSVKVEDLDFVVIDSQPLPVCRSKHASRFTLSLSGGHLWIWKAGERLRIQVARLESVVRKVLSGLDPE